MSQTADDSIHVLDKGFVRLVDLMGGDMGVVASARVSYGSGSKGEEKDRKLIRYLLQHDHMTPFEHAVFQFHVSCPLFVMRQWIRHRMASYNETSARYTEIKDEFYVPEEWRAPDVKNKQSSAPSPQLDHERCTRVLRESYGKAYAAYQELLKAGAARELARLVLPTSMYTQFYWTVNARSLMHFIGLRADANAQWEIQRYAEALADFFQRKMPWTYDAFLLHAWKGKNAKLDVEKSRASAQAEAKPA
ncbi:MAG: FAD-dependent thymidylate synthase [Elusimicrobia bacterium]|nr:FAD-dependent thymidylate synthase [Elusimicrobiota bacterium]